ncbi:MAG: class I SAM-dependent methyltransferase [Deltaproteobacteria bacterium]|nr:class I SAM-dependent methyltransferase [Deltaproteobacteria bacterium]
MAGNIFDEFAEDWDQDPAKVERARQVALSIRERIPLDRNWEAMEFGCGTAHLSFFLRSELGHITLVDNSAGMLAVVKRKIAAAGAENMIPWLADLTTGKVPERRFDLIYTLMVLHHLPDPGAILPVFGSLLREGGWLCVAELEKGAVSFHSEDFEGHDGFSRPELLELVSKAGFEALRIDDCCRIRRERRGRIEEFNILLLTGRKAIGADPL